MKFVKVCKICDGKFEATSGSQLKCKTCRLCRLCGEQMRWSHTQFCSIKCAAKWKFENCNSIKEVLAEGRRLAHNELSEQRAANISKSHRGKPKPRGEKNRNWKGGARYARHTVMGQLEYKVWRASVFKRDNWTCAICNSTSEIQAHHIKGWEAYPELRYEQTNGVTLCKPCHLKVDLIENLDKRFIEYVNTKTPITLTDSEISRFVPVVAPCTQCGTTLSRPPWKQKNRFWFCNLVCKRAFEQRINYNWVAVDQLAQAGKK